MAQNDMNIANQGFPAFRADLNDQLEALVTNSSGATAPSTTFPHQWWLDTSTTPSTLRQRNAADDAWIVVGLFNQSTNTFNLPVAQGGTGAADAGGARTNLGALASTDPSYTGTLTGGTGVINIGSGQLYKDASGNVGIGTSSPTGKLHIVTASSGATASTSANQIFIENSGDSGITIGSGSSNIGRINFADSGTNRVGAVDYSHSDNSLQFSTGNGSERMRIDSSGNVLVGKTSATANGGDLQVSSGITFPATQVPKSDANTLDDYEEGTWTPAYSFGTSGSVTQSLTSGRYTKIGNVVNLFCRIATSAISSPTGNVSITGLPFASASGSNYGVAIGQAASFASDVLIRAQIEPSVSRIDVVKGKSNEGAVYLQGSDFASGSAKNILDLSVTYRTS